MRYLLAALLLLPVAATPQPTPPGECVLVIGYNSRDSEISMVIPTKRECRAGAAKALALSLAKMLSP